MAEAGFDNCFTNKATGFVVAACYAAILTQPAEGALHHPAPGQHHKALGAGRSAHYLHAQVQRGGGRGHQRALVAGIGPEQLQLRRISLGFGQDRGGPHRVLHAGGLHEHSQG